MLLALSLGAVSEIVWSHAYCKVPCGSAYVVVGTGVLLGVWWQCAPVLMWECRVLLKASRILSRHILKLVTHPPTKHHHHHHGIDLP